MAKQAVAKAVTKAASRAPSHLKPALKSGQRRFGTSGRVVNGNSMLGKAEIFGRDMLAKPGVKPGLAGLGGIAGLLGLLGGSGGAESELEQQASGDPYSEPQGLSAMFDDNDPLARLQANTDLGSKVQGDKHLPSRGIAGSQPQARPRPSSPMTAALQKPQTPSLPLQNGVSSFAQGGVQAPSFGQDNSEFDSLLQSIQESTSKDPNQMGLPPKKEGGGFGDAMKQFGPVLAALLFGRLMK